MKYFRVISVMEGISYLLLVFIAMPLKYLYGNTETVKNLGMVHGILFILFTITLIYSIRSNNKVKKQATCLFYYSLVPFGFILIEYVTNKELLNYDKIITSKY